jgi:[acyl-carrier-protein] S-malonyltransferase
LPYAVIFPGQGAAVPGAGEAWQDHPSWAVVEQAEAVLERPLARLVLDADKDELATTEASRLAVLLTSLMAWDAFAAGLGSAVESQPVDDRRPVAFAGHSLGQITALVAAGAVERAEGLRLAARRAQLSQASADRRPGRMAALLGVEPRDAEKLCEGCEAWVANDNAPGQVVIAGTPDGLTEASERARAQGVRRVMPLDVGHAFHTPLLADAAEGLRPLLGTLAWTKPTAPVVCNTDGGLHRDAGGWTGRLLRHLVEPVQWQECQRTLADLGIDTVVELGPGRVLTGLARRTIPDVRSLNAATPDQVSGTLRRLVNAEGGSDTPTDARHSSPTPPPPTQGLGSAETATSGSPTPPPPTHGLGSAETASTDDPVRESAGGRQPHDQPVLSPTGPHLPPPPTEDPT